MHYITEERDTPDLHLNPDSGLYFGGVMDVWVYGVLWVRGILDGGIIGVMGVMGMGVL